MEEIQQTQPEENQPVNEGCINCGSLDYLNGYPNKLCAPCRTRMINYPIPLWVKLFGGGILAAMLIAMIWLPRNFKAALNLERAERAENKNQYLTEQRELEIAQKTAPNSTDILAHLMIASYANGDYQTLFKSASTLGGRSIDDKQLLSRLNDIMDRAQCLYPDSTYTNAFPDYQKKIVTDTALKQFIHTYPNNIYALTQLAAMYTNDSNYLQADSATSRLLALQPGYVPALSMKTSVKRELNQTDSAFYYCDALLAANSQNLYALSAKARVMLKVHRNAESMKLAQQCYALDHNDAYNTATLAMIYHFNKDYKKRDELVSLAAKDSVLASSMSYVQDIINNKIKFQN